MARISRKNLVSEVQNEPITRYKTAIYVRLSVLDGNRDDNDSIENQEALIRRYISYKEEFHIISTYIENGQSGVDFNRPAFEEMIYDVKSKKIDCIIVKDFSRFGRNYIEAGEYLENIFPFMGVRFISINDGYDSLSNTSTDELIMHLLNLTNDIYSRDISQKISPVLRAKQERGEFIGAWAAYGYLKDPQNKHKIIIDDEVATIVRKIFELKADGQSYSKIQKWLSENNFPSPSKYRYDKGLVKHEKWNKSLWTNQTIKNLLENQVYLGHMVQGRKRESLFEGKKQVILPKDEWIIVENTHKSIISQPLFDKANTVMTERKNEYIEKSHKYDHLGETENIFKGIIRCGCGSTLTKYKHARSRVNKNDEEIFYRFYSYICPVHATNISNCKFISIPEKDVISAVFKAIKEHINCAIDMKKLIDNRKNIRKFETKSQKLAKTIIKTKDELSKVLQYKSGLYDDYLDKLMSESDYVFATNRYKEKETELKLTLQELTKQELETVLEKPQENKWLTSMLLFDNEKLLTKNMAQTLIKNITVHDKQTIDIKFRFESEYEKLCEIVQVV